MEELRRWTSSEALGDITVNAECPFRINTYTNISTTDGHVTDGTVVSDDEGIDHKLPSPEEQLKVVALKCVNIQIIIFPPVDDEKLFQVSC